MSKYNKTKIKAQYADYLQLNIEVLKKKIEPKQTGISSTINSALICNHYKRGNDIFCNICNKYNRLPGITRLHIILDEIRSVQVCHIYIVILFI